MGIYSHYTTEKLVELRDRLTDALVARHTDPTRVSTAGPHGRDLTFNQGSLAELRKDIGEINAELARRNGMVIRGPIYMMT